jgi:amidase
MSDPAYRTAKDLLAALGAREIGSRELLEAQVERVARLNPPLNAIVATNLEAARERADAADEALARGERWGPLHGLPMTIKDAFEVVGMPTTSGAPELAKHVPERNADSVQRLIDAGAIVFGKTNLPLYAGDLQTYNKVYGTTNNPWDVSRAPGGSSGGSAAALAAGLTPIELGSDIGGSIRNPAHYCGVYGHKSSWGIVPGRGHIPGPPGALSDADLGVFGPMARSADDLALGLEVLAAPRPEEATGWRLELPAPRHERLGDFSVALWLDEETVPLDGELSALIQSAADAIAKAGASLRDDARPAIDPADSWHVYRRLLYGVMGAGLPESIRTGFDTVLPNLSSDDQSPLAQMVRGTSGRHRDWLSDNERRMHLRARWAEFFRDVDVLLCPISPTPAFPHDHSDIMTRTFEVNGERIGYFDQVFWAGLVTVAYLPSTVVPVGRTRAGLPVGMQVVAPYLEDRTSIRFARLIEEVVGGVAPPPGY